MELQQPVAASFAECPHILQRKVPREVCPFFFGASLLALEKDGGVRPIAVGCTLPSPCCHSSRKSHHGCYGTSFGTNEVILKLDFKNAFNTIQHDEMMKAIRGLDPELAQFVYSVYSKPFTHF